MPAPHAKVTVSPPEPAPNGPTGSRIVAATVFDDDHPDVAATFKYLAIATQPLQTIGVSVDSRAGDDPYVNATVGASAIREMPIARWDRTAQAAVVQQLGEATGEEPAVSAAAWAETLVSEKFPELNEPKDGHALRRRNSLLHLAEAAEEYTRIASTGERNPAGVLAARRGTTPSTVRGWLHRARREGVAGDVG
ncbi:hypothetical protein ACFRDV_16665 [Streptomyces fagopyri]|uniref:hypothetical protein n=1 Tax=Streptomyces fagopyri TaxID=2662397 RepID=UPI0036739A55